MSLCRNRLWAIGGGQGGGGKSFLTASLGTALARAGKSVIVVDAHLAAPNLHTYLGIKAPEATLFDVVSGRIALPEALAPTPEAKMQFASCAGDEPGMGDLSLEEREKLLDCISALEADFVLIDAGGGAAYSVLDFFNHADLAIVVATPDQTSLQSAYSFLRHAIFRKVQRQFEGHPALVDALRRMRETVGGARPQTMGDFLQLLQPSSPELAAAVASTITSFRSFLLLNMAASGHERMADIIRSAAGKFLNIEVHPAGWIPLGAWARKAASSLSPLGNGEPDGVLSRQISLVALKLAGEPATGEPQESYRPHRPAVTVTATGFNDNLVIMGRELHVQTEDMGCEARCITTQVFWEGHVILSTRADYPAMTRTPQESSQVIEWMRIQHFNVIREIENRKATWPAVLAQNP
jgi:flagellar biosynthesis protein FlhG